MTGWTRPADLKAQLQRLWERDALLSAAFPLRLVLRGPSSAALSERFDEVRGWVAELQQLAGCRLVMREVRHRIIGPNSVPVEAWVDSLDAALRLAGKQREGRLFDGLVTLTRQQQQALLPWMHQQPRRVIALADDWPRLLAIVGWLLTHPRPGLYLRQVDLPGVHSKYIESQRGVLAELLDIALPPSAIAQAARGVAQFAARYGFRDKPERVRLRFLDPGHAGWVAGGDHDISLSAASFARLEPLVQRVVITENEINFLAFPPLRQGLAIFGAGYGFEALSNAAWLGRCELLYWGDIDTHGFAILDQLRSHFAQVRSFLMDHEVLLAHQPLWGGEPTPTRRDLLNLTAEERRLYDDLRWCRLRSRPLRLEQERIGFCWVEDAVVRLEAAGVPGDLVTDEPVR